MRHEIPKGGFPGWPTPTPTELEHIKKRQQKIRLMLDKSEVKTWIGFDFTHIETDLYILDATIDLADKDQCEKSIRDLMNIYNDQLVWVMFYKDLENPVFSMRLDVRQLRMLLNRAIKYSGLYPEGETFGEREKSFRKEIPDLINQMAAYCHLQAIKGGWWNDHQNGMPIKRNHGELLCLIHSEVSEAFEGIRKDSMDEHLPHRKSVEVELSDLVIRVFDYAGAMGIDLGNAMVEKMDFNLGRRDHKPENRAKPGGKKF